MTEESRKLVLQILALAVSSSRQRADIFVDWVPHVNQLMVRVYLGGWSEKADPIRLEAYTDREDSELELRVILRKIVPLRSETVEILAEAAAAATESEVAL